MKKLYGAFDPHSSNNYLGISDEKDRRVYKKRLPNQPDVILAELTSGLVPLRKFQKKVVAPV